MEFLNKILQRFIPPSEWLPAVLVLSGVAVGILLYLFYVSKAYSYLSDQPSTCVNCHIMAPQFATWSHSSHHSTATCNDCHVPHNNFLNKYFYKAKDGARHATVFTLRNEPQVIFIKKAGIQVAQNNCFRCHEKIFPDNFQQRLNKEIKSNEKERLCWDCHRETPHGRINSLSAVPFARVPLPQSPVPDWLKSLMK